MSNYGHSYGEWAEPADVFPDDWKNIVLPHPEESTPYTVFIMEHMMEIAGYLGKQQDKALFEKYRDGCTKAYRELVTLPGYTPGYQPVGKARPSAVFAPAGREAGSICKASARSGYGELPLAGSGRASFPHRLYWMYWQIWMKIMFRAVESTAAKGYGGKKDYDNPISGCRWLPLPERRFAA